MKIPATLIIVAIYLALGCSAFALTAQERIIVEGMRDRLKQAQVVEGQKDATIGSLTATLTAQADEIVSMTRDLRAREVEIKAVVAERDGLLGRVAELGKTIDSQANHIVDLTKKVDAEKAEAHRNAKERDVVIWVFAIVVTGLSVSLMRPLLASVPPPYGILAWPVAVIAVFLACYGFGRVVLAQVASALPF